MSSISLAADVRKKIETFGEEQIDQFLSRPPDIIWHYTTGSTLIQIVESGSLWSTHVSCLNDQTEHRFAVGLLRNAFRQTRSGIEKPSDVQTFFFDRLEQALSGDITSAAGAFVACFSELSDDLSQWRAYGGGEGGYSIGFDGHWIASISADNASVLVPVSYDEEKNSKFASVVANAMFELYMDAQAGISESDRPAWTDAFLEEWSTSVSPFACFLKHPAFRAEREWRCIRLLGPGDTAKIRFQQRQSMLRRHLPLTFPPPDSPHSKLLPIKEIVVGPCRHKEISKIGVGDLLVKMNYPKERRNVSLSSVPFQSL